MANDWQGQRVLMIGAARQGLALARFLASRGAQVILNDARPAEQMAAAQAALAGLPVEWALGGHPLELLDRVDLVCLAGGVPLDLPIVAEARRRGLPLSNDSQIFCSAAPCPLVGITGSAGKTTTTTLVGRMANAALAGTHRQVWVGGNIGLPLVDLLDEMDADDLAVVELSSFQLELMTCAPQVAAVLNITPNHLDRHGTMEAYTAAKAHILDYQTAGSRAVLSRDDAGSWGLRERVRGELVSFGLQRPPAGQTGTFVAEDEPGSGVQALFLQEEYQTIRLLSRDLIRLRGTHNLVNVLAACAIAHAAGLPAEALAAGVTGFGGVAHRLEFVREWGGAAWYNDSIATAPERTLAAIRSFDEPLVLLLGGRDKNLPWGELASVARQRSRHQILFGEAADLIAQALGADAPATRCRNLQDAVQAAANLVKPGDVVLLSPGGTSYDEFRDFEERGEWYRKWVNELP